MKLVVVSTCNLQAELCKMSPAARAYVEDMIARNRELTRLLGECRQAIAASHGQQARAVHLLTKALDYAADELLKD